MSTILHIRITRDILQRAAHCGHIKKEGQYARSSDESVDPGCHCAIALAIRDIFPKAKVGRYVIEPFGDEQFSHCFSEIELPDEAQAFMEAFDDLMPEQRRRMPTTKFDVEVPDDVLEHAFQIESDLDTILKRHPTLRLE
jgi:hypothetical protein